MPLFTSHGSIRTNSSSVIVCITTLFGIHYPNVGATLEMGGVVTWTDNCGRFADGREMVRSGSLYLNVSDDDQHSCPLLFTLALGYCLGRRYKFSELAEIVTRNT